VFKDGIPVCAARNAGSLSFSFYFGARVWSSQRRRAIFRQAIQWNLNKVARHKCLPLARIDVAKSRPGHRDELAVRIERVDRIFRIQDPARRHIFVGYLLGAQAVGSDVSPDLVHRGTFDDGIASDAKEGKFHGGTFPIWRYVDLNAFERLF